jgi:hypothetical protein
MGLGPQKKSVTYSSVSEVLRNIRSIGGLRARIIQPVQRDAPAGIASNARPGAPDPDQAAFGEENRVARGEVNLDHLIAEVVGRVCPAAWIG